MEMKTAYPATLQDIIFEGRNKAYGAYLLRKIYPRHVWQALLMAIALFLLLITLPAMVGKLFGSDDVVVPHVKPKTPEWVIPHLPDPDPIIDPKVTEPPAGGGQKPVSTIKNTIPIVVDNKVEPKDEPPTNAAVAQSISGTATTEGEGPATGDSVDMGAGTGAGTGIGNGSGHGVGTNTSTEPFTVVEQMPQFEGGLAKLMDFLGRNIRYPASAQRNGVEGVVVASFVVMPNGEVGDITILKGLGYGTEEEAIRVLKKMPRWKPGVQNGRKVPVRMTLPIRLELK